jgi:hypothetical protein
MCPVRHEDDFRRKPIKSWDSWVEEAITEAQEEGAFDNLPGFGKPIHIESNPHAPELDLAFSRLKNAGYLPGWMELDKQIQTSQRQMQAFLDDSAAWLAHQANRIRSSVMPEPVVAPSPSWWHRLWHGQETRTRPDQGPTTLDDLRTLQARMEKQYLQRAAELDKLIGEFNNTLSRDLWHLERMRLPRDRAARKFAEAMQDVDLDHPPQ